MLYCQLTFMALKTHDVSILAVPITSSHEKNIEVLILSETGCGAFGHDPKVEPSVWKQTILEFGNHFTEISFSILGSRNFNAFLKEFGKEAKI